MFLRQVQVGARGSEDHNLRCPLNDLAHQVHGPFDEMLDVDLIIEEAMDAYLEGRYEDSLELADEAFLRRLGYKIRFDYLGPDKFIAIWQQVCEASGLEYDEDLVNNLIEQYYKTEQRPMLPCHPRDLIGLALDLARYYGRGNVISASELDAAWQSYFVKPQVTHL